MKITEHQLKRLIRESVSQFAPTASEEAIKINAQTGAGYVIDQAFWEKYGVITGEDLALSVLGQTYSDLYKSIHRIRPRNHNLKTVEDFTNAIRDLDEYASKMLAREELELEAQKEYEQGLAELEAMMPDEFDFQELPKMSGMGRRSEGINTVKSTKKQLKRIIKEEIQASYRKNVDHKSLEVAGLDHSDYPDYVDAYFSYGKYTDGTEMSDIELDKLSEEDTGLLYAKIQEFLY